MTRDLKVSGHFKIKPTFNFRVFLLISRRLCLSLRHLIKTTVAECSGQAWGSRAEGWPGREGLTAAWAAISPSASGSLRSTLLIKLCTNISLSIRGILILLTDQGHSDYYTLLKINLKSGLILEMCCRDVCPSLKLQQEKTKRKAVSRAGRKKPGKWLLLL